MYWTLLNHAWMNNGLPASDQDLIALLRITQKDFDRIWPRVAKCFPVNNERRTNPRQEEERTKAISKSVSATESIRSRYERTTNEDIRAYESVSVSVSVSECSSKDLNKKNSESSLPPDLRSMQAEWFNAFWRGYWRRVGRGAAEKSFALAVKSPAQFERVMQAIELQSPWMMARDSDKRPYPATWLNQKRWEDDADIQQAVDSRTRDEVSRQQILLMGLEKRRNA